ncbi:hypothetical protein [Hymenobacter sp. BT190]|uniref:hypothetical protein n=1 Tax=Hymenobacter sp. BT190 TaxID=2763505 RepID=UPI0016510BE1|nr:hypothetical protein [Hymenobacter sp. BT190]MBC6698903.1 hypothetical protein [Hymenobacter sp. BT190]
MTETSINQRLKILIDALGVNTRRFSMMVGVNDATTRTYLDRGSKPSAEYVASIISAVERINPAWLLLGKGEMFLTGAGEVQVVDAKRPDDATDYEKEALRREVEQLRQLLEAKDELLAAKEEVLALLRKGA